MKRIFIITTILLTAYISNAQYDLLAIPANTIASVENNSGYITYSDAFTISQNIFLHYTSSSAGNDTIYFPVTVGEIIPDTEEDTDVDTLAIDIALRLFHGNSGTESFVTDASFTYSNKYDSYEYTDLSILGGNNFYQTFKFVENQVDTIKVITTSGDITLDRIYVNSTGQEVISSLQSDLFGEHGVSFQNPVQAKQLSFSQFPSDFVATDISLISMEGQVVLTKHITLSDNSIDLATIPSGLYLMRDETTASSKKLMIK